MCQWNAYLARNGQEQLVAEDVTLVQVEGGKVLLTTLFEQQEAIDAKIQVVDLVRNRLLLAAADSEEKSSDGGKDRATEAGYTA